MNALRARNMMEVYNGGTGPITTSAVLDGIPDELASTLTGKQLGLVMNAVNAAYHRGKASTGAEMVDNNCVYISNLRKFIEWNEVGAEFGNVIEEGIDKNGGHYKSTSYKKVKDGELIPIFRSYGK